MKSCSLMPQASEYSLKSSKFSMCSVMTFLGQQTQMHRNKAGVLNMVLANIFSTVYVTNTLHKQFLVCDNFNHLKASMSVFQQNY